MRCACIDIGSNTIRLLVAEPGASGAPPLRQVHAERAFTRLGAGPAIAEAKLGEAARTVAAHVALARAHGAGRIDVVATAAVRRAANGAELCEAVRAAAGLEVRVLDEREEARLAFAGAVACAGSVPDGALGVVDVGGGSTELALGTAAGGVRWSASVPVGSATLHGRGSDPPSGAELDALRARAAAAFARVAVPGPPPCVAYAAGGSAASLARLCGGIDLTPAVLDAALARLVAAPAAPTADLLGLHLQRVRVLPAGLILLRAAVGALGVGLRIAGGGLREGVVLAAMGD